MRKALTALALVAAAALTGCVVTQYQYPVQPPPAAAPADDQYASAPEDQASEPPPPLPVYEQPPCPEEGYIWTPGVWRWGAEGYFWVPGTWVAPPQVGMLWTPGYWAMSGAVYVFHPGYWGQHVGYYGGINYGAGYDGDGYHGGRWVNNRFQYNTEVTNVNVTTVHSTYRETVVNNLTANNTNIQRVSYVGAGSPGTRAQPTRTEAAAAREPRVAPTPLQQQHHETARTTPELNAARNEGRPPIAATPRPSAFRAPEVTRAKPVGPAYHPQPAKEEKPGEHHP
jgi:hypothetical protein